METATEATNPLPERSINGCDKSGSLRHAGNGNGPNLQSGGLNGLNTLKFDGISQYLRVADSNVFDFGDEVTIFIVGQGHSSQNWRPMLSKREETTKDGSSERPIRIMPHSRFEELRMRIAERGALRLTETFTLGR